MDTTDSGAEQEETHAGNGVYVVRVGKLEELETLEAFSQRHAHECDIKFAGMWVTVDNVMDVVILCTVKVSDLGPINQEYSIESSESGKFWHLYPTGPRTRCRIANTIADFRFRHPELNIKWFSLLGHDHTDAPIITLETETSKQ